MDIFDEDLFEKGLAQRKATMGADFVEKIWPAPTTSPARGKKP